MLIMASNKSSYTQANEGGGSLAGVLIRMLAVGVAGSAILIAGAKAFGEKVFEKELADDEERKQDGYTI